MVAIDSIIHRCNTGGDIAKKMSIPWQDMELYVSCEPCIMCAAALSMLRLTNVYYGCDNDKFGGCGSILDLGTKRNDMMKKRSRELTLGGCNG